MTPHEELAALEDLNRHPGHALWKARALEKREEKIEALTKSQSHTDHAKMVQLAGEGRGILTAVLLVDTMVAELRSSLV